MLEPGQVGMDWSESVARVATAVGTERFERALMALPGEPAPARQCMLFAFHRDAGVQVLGLASEDADFAARLAERYRRGFWQSDPLLPAIRAAAGARARAHRVRSRAIAHPLYRRVLYDEPGLDGKLCLIGHATSGHILYLNLYHAARDPDDWRGLAHGVDEWGAVLIALAARHAELTGIIGRSTELVRARLGRHSALRGARLSRRETELCVRLLEGDSLPAAASSLGVTVATALTYQRRACRKLNVAGQRELFALLLGAE